MSIIKFDSDSWEIYRICNIVNKFWYEQMLGTYRIILICYLTLQDDFPIVGWIHGFSPKMSSLPIKFSKYREI